MSEYWWPLQARLIEQILGTSDHPDVPKARKALFELLDKANLMCCPNCGGQGGKILQPISIPFNPDEVFQDCKRCNRSGMVERL